MKMWRIVSLGIALTCVALVGPGRAEVRKWSTAELADAKGRVEILSCVKVLIERDKPAYLISFEYDFPNRSVVHLKGLGQVAAKGSFQYLSEDKELEFSEVGTKEVLVRVPINETIIVAAKPPLNQVPGENEFPPARRTYTWESPRALQERANAVLGKYFNYVPRESKDTTFLATTFTPIPLKGVPDGVLGEIALLITFPSGAGEKAFSFDVRSLIKEGRTLSDEFRPTSNRTIVDSAKDFVDSLVKEMKAAEQAKP
jgi:hypothetical protein